MYLMPKYTDKEAVEIKRCKEFLLQTLNISEEDGDPKSRLKNAIDTIDLDILKIIIKNSIDYVDKSIKIVSYESF